MKLIYAYLPHVISRKNKEGELIVTYPDALTEKVINERSLLEIPVV